MKFLSFYLLSPRTGSNKVFPMLLFLMLIQIRLITSGPFVSSCTTADNFNNGNCFNDIIQFDDKKYRAGHSLTNKNNTLIIMFSDDSPGDSRLVYAIKENGRGYYANENKIKLITLTNLGNYSRHEGKINLLFLYLHFMTLKLVIIKNGRLLLFLILIKIIIYFHIDFLYLNGQNPKFIFVSMFNMKIQIMKEKIIVFHLLCLDLNLIDLLREMI